jgi:hypothetical protein
LPSSADVEKDGLRIDLEFAPGSRYSYSNKNYSLLGLLIEKVAEQGFCEFVHERVFGPIAMTASSCGSHAQVEMAPEHQYCFGFALRVDPTDPQVSQLPAGFLRCAARDLARLQICLLRDGVLDGEQVFPAQLVRKMKTPGGDADIGYGMGLASSYLEDVGPIIAHEGATPTSYAFHGALTRQEVGIVLLININLFDPFTDHGELIYTNILRILDGQKPIRSYPYRIWMRWALIPILLFTVWQVGALLIRWKRAGWPFAWPATPGRRLCLMFQLALPIAIWVLVLRWVQIPLRQLLLLDPDVMWSFLFLTAAGMVQGIIQTCGGEAVLSRRRRPEVQVDTI